MRAPVQVRVPRLVGDHVSTQVSQVVLRLLSAQTWFGEFCLQSLQAGPGVGRTVLVRSCVGLPLALRVPCPMPRQHGVPPPPRTLFPRVALCKASIHSLLDRTVVSLTVHSGSGRWRLIHQCRLSPPSRYAGGTRQLHHFGAGEALESLQSVPAMGPLGPVGTMNLATAPQIISLGTSGWWRDQLSAFAMSRVTFPCGC